VKIIRGKKRKSSRRSDNRGCWWQIIREPGYIVRWESREGIVCCSWLTKSFTRRASCDDTVREMTQGNGRGSRHSCVSSPRYVSFNFYLCTLLIIICRLLLRLPTLAAPSTTSNTTHPTDGTRPTLAANASRWVVFTHAQPHPRSKSKSVGLFLEYFHTTTHPGPYPRCKRESVGCFYATTTPPSLQKRVGGVIS
jgi:hypothetical protein